MSSMQLILFISFADSMLYGLIVPFTTSLLQKLGANHFEIGVLGSLRSCFNILAEYLIIAIMNRYGYNFTLTFTLAINCVTFFMLYAGPSAMAAVFYRLLYFLTNRTKFLCHLYLSYKETYETRLFIEGLLYLSSIFGLLVGPLISGTLLSFDGGYSLIFYTASIISLTSTISSVYLDDLIGVKLQSKMKEDFVESIKNFTKITWKKQWSVLTMKYLLVMGYLSYTTKFPLLLNVQFRATPLMIGCVHAYIRLVSQISEHLINGYEHYPNADVSHLPKYLASHFLFTMIMCYTVSYEYYYTAVGLYVLCEIYIRRKWYCLYKNVRDENNKIEKSTKDIEFLSHFITPVIVGICCDLFGHNTIRGFASISTGLAFIISYFVPKVNNDDDILM